MSHTPAPPAARSMTGAEWGMLILLSILWGGSFLFVGVAVKEVPVFSVVAVRVTLAAIALLVVTRAMGIALPCSRAAILAFFGMSLLNNIIPFNLIVFGQSKIDSGLASILNATTPIFTIVFAHFLTSDEKMGPRKAIGAVLGFLGVAALFSGRDLMDGASFLAQLACIGASVSYAFSGIFGRRFARLGLEPIVIATGQLTASALVMVPLSMIVDAPFSRPMPSLAALASLSVLALASTAGAYILFFRILNRAGATNISLVTLLVPCSAILFGVTLLGESLGPREVIGFAIIALGLLVIDGRMLRHLPFGRG
jgi:drug/metabolite transporter (DMT)-like permease